MQTQSMHVAPFQTRSAVLAAAWVGTGTVFAILVALAIAPLMIWPIPRTADMINHWARLSLVGAPADDALRAIYAFKLGIIPNLAVDLAAYALTPLLSAQAIVTLAWAGAIVLPAWGAWRINIALFGRPQLTMLIAPLACYNVVVSAGMLNYALGMGLALHAIAWWLTIDRTRVWMRVLVFNVIGVGLFFCHIAAYGAFCLIAGMIEASPRAGDSLGVWARRCAIAVASTGFACGLWFFAEPIDGRIIYASAKSIAVMAPFVSGVAWVDMVGRIGAVGLLGYSYLRRILTFAPQMILPVIGFGAFAIIIPSSWGAGSLLDARLTTLWFFLAIAAVGWRGDKAEARRFSLFAGAICLLHVGLALPAWQNYNRTAMEFRRAIEVIGPGQRALVVSPVKECEPDVTFLQHLANFVIIDRRAGVSTLFTGKGMQPVRLIRERDKMLPWDAVDPRFLEAAKPGAAATITQQALSNWRAAYDVIIDLHDSCPQRLDGLGLKLLAQSALVDIYAVK